MRETQNQERRPQAVVAVDPRDHLTKDQTQLAAAQKRLQARCDGLHDGFRYCSHTGRLDVYSVRL